MASYAEEMRGAGVGKERDGMVEGMEIRIGGTIGIAGAR